MSAVRAPGWRRPVAALLALLALPVAVGAAVAAGTVGSLYALAAGRAAPAPADAPAPPAHRQGRPTAALVVGGRGANVADLLAPYEVLAATGAFNLYTVAPERRPVPLTGGLDFVPDLTFAELDARLGGAAPDVVVVPAMPDAGRPTNAPVAAWLRRWHERRAGDDVLLSVCYGAAVVASAGLLDGHDATSAWIRLPGLERRHPEVTWRHGIRYVDDGDVISTGAVLSGVDGTLRVVGRLLGTGAAAAAARSVGWRHHVPGGPARLPDPSPTPRDAIALLNLAYRWHPTTIGVLLSGGVGELELASAFSPYTEQSFSGRTLAVSVDGAPVRSRHGLTFVPRASLAAAAGRVDRLLVPGAEAARRRDPEVAALAEGVGLTPEYLHERPGFAFDAALRDLARTVDVPTARWAAKALEYPAEDAGLAGPGWPWALTLRPLALALAGLAAAAAADRLARRGRRSRRARRAAEPAVAG